MKRLMFVAALVLAWPSLARAKDETFAEAIFYFLGYTDPFIHDSRGGPHPLSYNWIAIAGLTSVQSAGLYSVEGPFPIDAWAGIAGDFWTIGDPPLSGEAMWALANETGRVRALARTGAPAKASTALTPTVRSSVLFPDMFEPLTTSNCGADCSRVDSARGDPEPVEGSDARGSSRCTSLRTMRAVGING